MLGVEQSQYEHGYLLEYVSNRRIFISAKFKPPNLVTERDLQNIGTHASMLRKKAMELTDVWGVMFFMDEDSLRNIAHAIGLPEEICSKIYATSLAQAYAHELGFRGKSNRAVFTWHGGDSSILIVRGATDLSHAMSIINDNNVEELIRINIDIFMRVMQAIPVYAKHHMFSPKIASAVLASFGASVSPEKFFSLAQVLGGATSKDDEGRQGISTQFIRAVH